MRPLLAGRRLVRVTALLLAFACAGVTAFGVGSAHAWTAGTQGCTPGYWKNHPSAWVKFTPGESVGFVYSATQGSSFASETLMDALNGQGGSGVNGATEILLRASTAALLNVTAGLDYGSITPGGVRFITDKAIASGNRDTILALATKFDTRNNAGCPLS